MADPPVPLSPPPTYRPPSAIPAAGLPAHNPIGLYGWRKRCLYLFILMLVAVMLVNLGLTVWILVVLDFNQNGMGNLDISDSGIRLVGSAEFTGPLYAQSIATDQGAPLDLVSDTGISLTVGNRSSVQLTNTSLSIAAEQIAFSTSQQPHTPVFSASEKGVCVGASLLEVIGSLGAEVNGPVETSAVQSPPNADLQLQSLSGELMLTGAGGLTIQDSPGSNTGVSLTSQTDLTLTSLAGQVVFDSRNIVFQGVAKAAESDDVYQVCVCGGTTPQLYLVPATSTCQQHFGICITLTTTQPI